MIELLLVVGLALVISFLCSILESVFLSITHSHAIILSEQGSKSGILLKKMRENIDEPIAAILTLNTISHTIGASIGGALALKVFGDEWLALFSAVLTFAILMFSEIFPKTIGARYWKKLTAPTTYILRALIIAMKPILIPLAWLNRLLTPDESKGHTVSRSELAILAEIGRREGVLNDDEWQVVQNVFHLDEILVREVMTPRTDMIAVPITATVAEVKEVMIETGNFRVPVFDGSLDKVVGIIVARELLRAERDGELQAKNCMREAYFVPDSKVVDDLLAEMRQRQIKMSIVVDEFGGVAGLVTLEDLIEEIVGEIQDEHERELPLFRINKNGNIRILGTAPIDDVNETLQLDLPTDNYDTLGGYLLGALGRIPRLGDEIAIEQGMFRVLSTKGLRAERILFIPKERKKTPKKNK